MTIRIPKRLLFTVLIVIALTGVGVGGYALGRHSRADVAGQLSLLERRDASVAADSFVHEQDTIRQLHNLCQEVIRLPPAVGSFPRTCDSQFQVPPVPQQPQSIVEHQNQAFLAIANICNDVLQIQGGDAMTDTKRTNCAAGYESLPSQPSFNFK